MQAAMSCSPCEIDREFERLERSIARSMSPAAFPIRRRQSWCVASGFLAVPLPSLYRRMSRKYWTEIWLRNMYPEVMQIPPYRCANASNTSAMPLTSFPHRSQSRAIPKTVVRARSLVRWIWSAGSRSSTKSAGGPQQASTSSTSWATIVRGIRVGPTGSWSMVVVIGLLLLFFCLLAAALTNSPYVWNRPTPKNSARTSD
mmetsp:Transcript_7396/g.18118  ORF Transcript_7396/g.18118 Transcript_7396/m.18118 type:complete len:201 (+) Transcript_7396:862-1464(+)